MKRLSYSRYHKMNSANNLQTTISNVVGNVVNSNDYLAAANTLTGGAVEKVANQAVNRAGAALINGINGQLNGNGGSIGNINGNGGGGGSSAVHYEFTSGGNFISRLDVTPEPGTFKLDTGIPINVYSDYFHKSRDNFAVLHGTVVDIRIPSDANDVYSFTDGILTPSFRAMLASSVNFQVVSNLVTTNKVVGAMDALTTALHLYYYMKSIFVYNSSGLNNNRAMAALYSQFSADDIVNYSKLERILIGTPIPPNLNKLIWYVNGNYLSSEMPGSPVIKMFPAVFTAGAGSSNNSLNTGFTFDSSKISPCLVALRQHEDLFALFARATRWVDTPLLSYPLGPLYDCDFLTIWQNLPTSYGNNTVGYNLPTAANASTDIMYQTRCNVLDGAAYALSCVFVNSIWQPTLLKPRAISYNTGVNARTTNRFSYYAVVGDTNSFVWIDTNSYSGKGAARCETHAPNGDNTNTGFFLGSQYVNGVNQVSMSNTTLKLTEWLFTLESIGRIEDKKVYNDRPRIGSKPKSNYKGRKKRGK